MPLPDFEDLPALFFFGLLVHVLADRELRLLRRASGGQRGLPRRALFRLCSGVLLVDSRHPTVPEVGPQPGGLLRQQKSERYPDVLRKPSRVAKKLALGSTYALLLALAGCAVGGSHAVLPDGGASVVGPEFDGGSDGRDGSDDLPAGEGDGNQGGGDRGGDGDDTQHQDVSVPTQIPGLDSGRDDGYDTPNQDGGPGAAQHGDGGSDHDLGVVAPAGCTAQSFGGHAYLFCTDVIWWDEARSACQAQGLDLVVIETQDENAFVKGHIIVESWIGLNDIDIEGTFLWIVPGDASVSGALITFEAWSTTNPDDCAGFGHQDCVIIGLNGQWDDMACNESQTCPVVTWPRQYVCESY